MPHQRVASLLPSATEIVAALGCADRLVGRSHECDYPLGTEALPVCTRPRLELKGSSAEIDIRVKEALRDAQAVYEVLEDILEPLEPDIIVTQSQCDICAVNLADVEAAVCDWANRDIKIVSLEPNALEDVYTDITNVAEALGVADSGDTLINRMRTRATEIEARAKALQSRPRVACIEWTDPPMAAGNWLPELVAMAGGEDLFGVAGKHAPWLEWEALIKADPDVIVFMPCGFDLRRTRHEAEQMAQRPGWSGLSAVKSGRVYLTNGGAYFNRPGPRLSESLEILAEILHPGEFEFGHAASQAGDGWEQFTAS